MKFKSVVARKRGGPDVLEIVENELREPDAGEVRVRVLAAGVSRTDVNYRHGESVFAPRVPFVPGYQAAGIVDAIGEGVTAVAMGDRVAALLGHGGYAEMLYVGQEHLAHVPASLDPAGVAVLTLNYVSAYQMLHRVAKVKAGDTTLVIGASGGVGTALLDLGKLAGVKMYGTASTAKHAALAGLSAKLIDYHRQNFAEVVRQAEPQGIDFVFDGVGGDFSHLGMNLLRRGGKMVVYPAPGGFFSLMGGMVKLILANLRPKVRTVEFYGITALYMRDKRPFMEDFGAVCSLLEKGWIKPIIMQRLPILEARKANELLESGQVTGNIVLLAPELL